MNNIKDKVYTLAYMSFNCEDYDPYVEVLGVFDTLEGAKQALHVEVYNEMLDNPHFDIYHLRKTDLSWKYLDDMNNSYVMYRIQELAK